MNKELKVSTIRGVKFVAFPIEQDHGMTNFVVLFDPTLKEVVETAKILRETFIYTFLTRGNPDEVCVTWGSLSSILGRESPDSLHYVMQPEYVPGIDRESLSRIVRTRVMANWYSES